MNEEKQNELIQTFMEISYVPDNDALSLKKKCTSIAMSDLSFSSQAFWPYCRAHGNSSKC